MTIIVFVHKGVSSYLPETLRIATITNPDAHRILIGDAANEALARAHGWRHVALASLETAIIDRFRAGYQLIATPNFHAADPGGDMTRFCFERYHYAAAVATSSARRRSGCSIRTTFSPSRSRRSRRCCASAG